MMSLLQVALIVGTFLFLIVAMYAKSTKKPLGEAADELLNGVVGLFKSGSKKGRGKKLSKEGLDEYEQQIKLKERRAKLIERDRKVEGKLGKLEGDQ